jgi:hypothetical protein
MVLRNRRFRTDVVWIIGISDITTWIRSKKGSGAFVTSDFGDCWVSSWEFEDISRVRRVSQMIVEPPFLEIHVFNGSNGSIVIGKGFSGDIEPKHTRVEHSYQNQKKGECQRARKQFESLMKRTSVSRHLRENCSESKGEFEYHLFYLL